MKLGDYLIAVDLTPAQFARLVGVGSRTTIHRYISGERLPHERIMRRIEHVTGGMVTIDDFQDPTPIVLYAANDNEPDYPWSRSEEREQELAEEAVKKVRAEPAEGSGPSPALRMAFEVLGGRARERHGQFFLDGRPVRLATLIRQANMILIDQQKPMIRYPGVLPAFDD